jgi:hypothetical protein
MRFIVAMFAAVLPKRWWHELEEHLPVRQAAVMSGLVTFLVAVAIFIPAFLNFAQANAGHAVDLMLEATGWRPPATDTGPVSVETAQTSWLAGFPSIFVFALFTPLGIFSTYLAITGLLRAVSAFVDDARGDPLLTTIDTLVARFRSRGKDQRATEARRRLEGDEVADLVITGAAAGLRGAELVVVASRQKDGWEAGTILITQEKWYRIGSPVERDTPTGLRTLYPLNEAGEMEVLRTGIQYDLPETIGDKARPSRP